jgi:hypothetical protein
VYQQLGLKLTDALTSRDQLGTLTRHQPWIKPSVDVVLASPRIDRLLADPKIRSNANDPTRSGSERDDGTPPDSRASPCCYPKENSIRIHLPDSRNPGQTAP